jgi:hypothetical protein
MVLQSNRILFRYFDGLSNAVRLSVVFSGATLTQKLIIKTEDIKHTSQSCDKI